MTAQIRNAEVSAQVSEIDFVYKRLCSRLKMPGYLKKRERQVIAHDLAESLAGFYRIVCKLEDQIDQERTTATQNKDRSQNRFLVRIKNKTYLDFKD